MRSKLALALAAAALLAACAQSPTASTPARTPAARFDGGTTGTTSATEGTNTLGSGH